VSHSFHPEAEAEYLKAVAFFEERRAGLGKSLISEFERYIKLAEERPKAWKQIHPSGVRRIGLRRFPFSILFRTLETGPQVTAFAHHRRRPGYWLSRIGV
jgi:toxin ParE1/3/4